MKRILTIAGSDSGGGAGIQEDLKVITVLGGYGMSVITALTAQNTVGVHGIHEVPVPFVEAQIDAVISDIGVDAVKTGMLASPEIVELVARKLRHYSIGCVVVDPVMVAKSGDLLLAEEARETLKQKLVPCAHVITPNLAEASVLTGMEVSTLDQMYDAASAIHHMGASHVLIKGGHLEKEAMDLLYDGMTYREFRGPRISTSNTHGTGCTYSAAIATLLAGGMTVSEAVAEAKLFMTRAIRHALPLGAGHGPTNPYAWLAVRAERYDVLQELKQAYETLRGARVGHLIPEVQTNLGYALSAPEGPEDVAAWPGRIVRYGDTVSAVGYPSFGASRHVARIILTAMRFHPLTRAAANIRFSDEIIEACRRAGLAVSSFDRTREPSDVKAREGSTLSWGVEQCLSEGETIPDIIFDRGDVGKEPMVRVLGRDPVDVVHKILRIA
ncbi:MAG: bifunctional hydroxymethylpyrimidine kinase/phosphomethylpyrimidine kinase [Deltaproteobacteria bacterium]|nr:bifunctional hydroxymethylpyrimidine kinase/phosphomethylpyrimidine kinase [Deltaproteobacteria bacterium]MBW2305960.1 bifunctional hydroxymethylpyrimidine kinase/phosphomethylpyrimidine kinase [Deltaproteobacteria bacterium]